MQAGRTPQPIANGVGKQNVLYQAFMVVFESLAHKLVNLYIYWYSIQGCLVVQTSHLAN